MAKELNDDVDVVKKYRSRDELKDILRSVNESEGFDLEGEVAEEVEEKEIFTITDERNVTNKFEKGEEFYLDDNRFSCRFHGLTENGEISSDDGKFQIDPSIHIITKSVKEYKEWYFDQIKIREGAVCDKRNTIGMVLKQGDNIYIDNDQIAYRFDGLTEKGKMILNGGMFEWNPEDYVITKTKKEQKKWNRERLSQARMEKLSSLREQLFRFWKSKFVSL